MADVAVTRTDFQYQSSEAADNYEPVIQHVWSQKQNEEKADTKTTMSGVTSEKEAHFTYAYDRPTMLATAQACGSARINASEANKISFVHIAPKVDARRLSYNGSQAETSGSSPSNSPETVANSTCSGFGENLTPCKVRGALGKQWLVCLFSKVLQNDAMLFI